MAASSNPVNHPGHSTRASRHDVAVLAQLCAYYRVTPQEIRETLDEIGFVREDLPADSA